MSKWGDLTAQMRCKLHRSELQKSIFKSEYIAPNQATYNLGKQQTEKGLTSAQIKDRNNAAGTPIAKDGGGALGGYVLAQE